MRYRCLNCHHLQDSGLACDYCSSTALRLATPRPESGLLALAQLDLAVRRLAASGASLEFLLQKVTEVYKDRQKWS